jgi:mono/diheme cytochrome c family protein
MISARMLLPNMLAAITALSLLPVRGGAEDLSAYDGSQLYQRFCASCHGVHGLGDGSVAPSLKISVPDLTHIARRHGGKFPTDVVRREGPLNKTAEARYVQLRISSGSSANGPLRPDGAGFMA